MDGVLKGIRGMIDLEEAQEGETLASVGDSTSAQAAEIMRTVENMKKRYDDLRDESIGLEMELARCRQTLSESRDLWCDMLDGQWNVIVSLINDLRASADKTHRNDAYDAAHFIDQDTGRAPADYQSASYVDALQEQITRLKETLFTKAEKYSQLAQPPLLPSSDPSAETNAEVVRLRQSFSEERARYEAHIRQLEDVCRRHDSDLRKLSSQVDEEGGVLGAGTVTSSSGGAATTTAASAESVDNLSPKSKGSAKALNEGSEKEPCAQCVAYKVLVDQLQRENAAREEALSSLYEDNKYYQQSQTHGAEELLLLREGQRQHKEQMRAMAQKVTEEQAAAQRLRELYDESQRHALALTNEIAALRRQNARKIEDESSKQRSGGGGGGGRLASLLRRGAPPTSASAATGDASGAGGGTGDSGESAGEGNRTMDSLQNFVRVSSSKLASSAPAVPHLRLVLGVIFMMLTAFLIIFLRRANASATTSDLMRNEYIESLKASLQRCHDEVSTCHLRRGGQSIRRKALPADV